MAWSWADDGALSTLTTPGGRTLRHVRSLSDNHHLLQRLEVDGVTVAEVTRRDGNLRPTRLSLGGGRQTLGLRYDEPTPTVSCRRWRAKAASSLSSATPLAAQC